MRLTNGLPGRRRTAGAWRLSLRPRSYPALTQQRTPPSSASARSAEPPTRIDSPGLRPAMRPPRSTGHNSGVAGDGHGVLTRETELFGVP